MKAFHRYIPGSSVGLECSELPPKSAAAADRSLQVYRQTQEWPGQNLDHTDWGWFRIQD